MAGGIRLERCWAVNITGLTMEDRMGTRMERVGFAWERGEVRAS